MLEYQKFLNIILIKLFYKNTITITKMSVAEFCYLRILKDRIGEIEKSLSDVSLCEEDPAMEALFKLSWAVGSLIKAYQAHGNFCLRRNKNTLEYEGFQDDKRVSVIEIYLETFPSAKNLEKLMFSLEVQFKIRRT